MFVFDRSAFAVLVPLALLAGVALWSNRSPGATGNQPVPQSAQRAAARSDQAVAANLPSR